MEEKRVKKTNNLTAQEKMRIGQSMSAAFFSEDNFLYMIPESKNRHHALSWFFGNFVSYISLKHGYLFCTDTFEGASMWLSPGEKVKFLSSLQAGFFKLPYYFGIGSFFRCMKLNVEIEKMRKKLVPEPHFYLMALGVDPKKQKQGIGKKLLTPVLQEADTLKEPCYLETFSKKNIFFYKHFGFELIEEGKIKNGPVFWCMKRRPAKH